MKYPGQSLEPSGRAQPAPGDFRICHLEKPNEASQFQDARCQMPDFKISEIVHEVSGLTKETATTVAANALARLSSSASTRMRFVPSPRDLLPVRLGLFRQVEAETALLLGNQGFVVGRKLHKVKPILAP